MEESKIDGICPNCVEGIVKKKKLPVTSGAWLYQERERGVMGRRSVETGADTQFSVEELECKGQRWRQPWGGGFRSQGRELAGHAW